MKKIVSAVLLLLIYMPALFSNSKADQTQGVPGIMVSIPPQEYLLDQITGDLIEVNSLMSPQDNVHNFNPTPSKINQLSQSRFYFPVGISLEGAFLEDIASTLPDLEIHDFHESLHLIEMTAHDHHDDDHHDDDHHDEDHHDEDHHDEDHHDEDHHDEDHHDEDHHDKDHHGEDHHDHGEWDPHIWLGIHQMEDWLSLVVPLLVEAYPQYSEALQSNYQAFQVELEELEERLESNIPDEEAQLFVAHPAFGYFCHQFDVEQLTIEIEGKEPSPRQLEGIIEEAQQREISNIVVQPQFSHQAAGTIAEAIGGQVVPINPLSYNWIETMEQLSLAVQRSH